ncbi:hypothetical protein BdWA1_001842 [Babesia duncani]|uniref:Uncharacterized protein n=1 Tax=Babesia duncani TaxID=323732 RepID=A0AAD9PKW8_9APIC|nr:hypothetical protein BdWA1_001842 [Babesia duncani]
MSTKVLDDDFGKSFPESKETGRNLFQKQFENLDYSNSNLNKLRNDPRWQDIIMEEIAKNRSRHASDEFLFGESHHKDDLNYSKVADAESDLIRKNFNYRLSPEGRLKLENRIEFLKRVAHTNPGTPQESRPNLWIVRSAHGNYCKLLQDDEPKIKSLVQRVRTYFTKDQLQILCMKLDVKMPLCEIFFEGTMCDMVRILYARGGTLQFYVVPRFWTRCELLEKDPTLEAKYGKATAPGLFPQWNEDGMIEEIIDCMDIRPDYALEFIQPNAWHIIPLLPEKDKQLMEKYFNEVHWPTRVRVQRAFELGVEDYRDVIAEEYRQIRDKDNPDIDVLDEFL